MKTRLLLTLVVAFSSFAHYSFAADIELDPGETQYVRRGSTVTCLAKPKCKLEHDRARYTGGSMEYIRTVQSTQECLTACQKRGLKYCSIDTVQNGSGCYGGNSYTTVCVGHECGCNSGNCFAGAYRCQSRR